MKRMWKKTRKYYFEYRFFAPWPGMLFAVEVKPEKTTSILSVQLSLTILCCSLFDIEITRYRNIE